MSTDAVAVIGFVSLFTLMLLRVPIGMALGLVGVTGFGYLTSMSPALKIVGHTTMRTVTDFNYAVVPLFLLMGAFATASGMSRELYAVAHSFLGHFRGGLGIATIAASGGFAAISGSSVASAATFANVAYPEMRRYGYPKEFAAGVIAAGGTLGIMIPPSVVLAVYGIITEQDIGKLFIAGIIPGLIAAGMYILTVNVLAFRNPSQFPATPRATWSERFTSLREVWAIIVLFAFVIGGIYGGVFTPTEAAGMGAGGAFLISLLRGRLTTALTIKCLVDTVRTSAAVFTILIGAMIFGYFLTITQTPQKITDFITHIGLGRYQVLLLVMLMYLVLGCILDAMAMIVLTIPIIFPAMMELGFDPIWFGVIIVMTVELGLITPPVGMNVYVINSVLKDISLSSIFYGVMPFVITDVIRLGILIAFPILSTFLPSQM
jgi:C4-dicarboxylate transporter, DctM subunit